MLRYFIFLCILCSSATTLASERYNYESALSLYQQQEYQTAFIHLRHVLHEQPDNLAAKMLLGSILYQQARFFEAVYLFEEALTDGADINLIFTELVTSYQITSQYDAILHLSQHQNMSVGHRFHWLLTVFSVHLERHEIEDAMATLHTAEQLNRTAHYQLDIAKSRLALAQDKQSKATMYIERALEANASSAAAWRQQGDILRQQQLFMEAEAAYQRAYQLAPDDPITMRELTAAFIATGQMEQAHEILQSMLDMGLEDPYIRFASFFLTALKTNSLDHTTDLQALHAELVALPINYFEQRPEQLYIRASAGYILGTMEQSLRDYELYLQLMPKDMEALLIASEIYRRTRERSQILRFLEQHQQQVEQNPSLLALQVQTALELERVELAEQLVTSARARFPQYEPLLLLDTTIKSKLFGADYANQFLQQAAQNESTTILLRQALLAIDAQHYQQAYVFATRLVQLEPTADHLNLMAGILLKSGQFDAAQHHLDRLFALDAEHFTGKLTQANLWVQNQQLEQAAQWLQSLLLHQPRHLQVTTLLAIVELGLQQQSAAEARLIELLNRQYYRPAIDVLIQHYMTTNQRPLALSLLQRALRHQFMQPDLLLQQATVQLQMQDTAAALDTLRLVESMPNLPNASRFELAMVYKAAKQANQAVATLQQLMNLAPDVLLFQLEYTQLLLQQQNMVMAKQQLERLLLRYPDQADVLLLQGDYLLANNQHAEAFALYRRAIQHDPSFQRAWANLYELARRADFSAQFSALTTIAVEQRPADTWLRRLLAEHYMNHSLYQLAQLQYRELLAQGAFQSDAMLMNNLAISLLDESPEQAMDFARQAITLTPNHAGRLTTFARTLIAMQQYAEALPRLRQAFSLDSTSHEVNYLTAVCLIKLQRASEAKPLLQELAAQENTSEFVDLAKQRLTLL